MDIRRINQTSRPIEAYKPQKTKLGQQTYISGSDFSKDEISTSLEARYYALARKAAAQIPDVRDDKVAAIIKRMETGTYDVSAASIAQKMLDESC